MRQRAGERQRERERGQKREREGEKEGASNIEQLNYAIMHA